MYSKIILALVAIAFVLDVAHSQSPEEQAQNAANQAAAQMGNMPIPGAQQAAQMAQQGATVAAGFVKTFKAMADTAKDMAQEAMNQMQNMAPQ